MEVLGADLLTNGGGGLDTKLPELETVDLKFDDIPESFSSSSAASAPPPKLVPSASEIGPTRSWDGVENLNAETYMQPASSSSSSSSDSILREKYRLLSKFDRMKKAGIPVRKQFTLDSPIDEMRMEYEFLKDLRAMDSTVKQFSDWFVSGMSALEWSSKNVNMVKSFGLQLNGLTQAAEMNVTDMEEDFEELYDMYGEVLKLHPAVRIPIRMCRMIYMVHLTNQMAQSTPVNVQDILRQRPDIMNSIASAAMEQQSQTFRAPMPAPPPPAPTRPRPAAPAAPRQAPAAPAAPANNPLAGLMNFMSGTTVPARPPAQPPPRPAAAATAPRREMKGPSGAGIGDILQKIQQEEKKVVAAAPAPPTAAPKSALRKSATSEAKKSARNSVIIKL